VDKRPFSMGSFIEDFHHFNVVLHFTFRQISKCFLSNGIKNMHILASGPELQADIFGYVILGKN
jgi:hypothetical protein